MNRCQSEETADLSDTAAIDQAFTAIGSADCVIHSAAMISWDRSEEAQIRRMNVDGVKAIAEACVRQGIGHLVFISAGARYGFAGTPDQPVNESVTFVPPERDPYARSKYDAEEVLRGYADRLAITILYPSTVYGPGDMKMNSGTLIRMLRGRSFPLGFPGGTSWVDVRDLADAVQAAVERSASGLERVIVSAENLSYRDLFRRIRLQFADSASSGIPLPMWMRPLALLGVRVAGVLPVLNKIGFLNVNIFEGFFKYRYFDASHAHDVLDWTPRHRLEVSVKDAAEFYDKHQLW